MTTNPNIILDDQVDHAPVYEPLRRLEAARGDIVMRDNRGWVLVRPTRFNGVRSWHVIEFCPHDALQRALLRQVGTAASPYRGYPRLLP